MPARVPERGINGRTQCLQGFSRFRESVTRNCSRVIITQLRKKVSKLYIVLWKYECHAHTVAWV